MHEYQCEKCGHLNSYNMGTNPQLSLQGFCEVCSKKMDWRNQVPVSTYQTLISNPDLKECLRTCSCRVCKPSKNNKFKEIFLCQTTQ